MGYDTPRSDPLGNPLMDSIRLLAEQSGPRGSTFLGRTIPFGSDLSPSAAMMLPTQAIPEEGYFIMPNAFQPARRNFDVEDYYKAYLRRLVPTAYMKAMEEGHRKKESQE